MSQENGPRKVRRAEQVLVSLQLRATGATYGQIAKAISVSRSKAYRLVGAAMAELAQESQETAAEVRRLELYRLDRLRLALDAKRSDPRCAEVLLKISERTAKLHGLDAPQKIEASASIQTQKEEKLDLGRLAYDELAIFDALHRKAAGDPNWDEGIRYYGTPEYERQWPGKPTRLLTAFVKALPFNDEPWRLPALPESVQP
jgi:hypothetical protein